MREEDRSELEVLDRFLGGEATPAEEARVLSFLARAHDPDTPSGEEVSSARLALRRDMELEVIEQHKVLPALQPSKYLRYLNIRYLGIAAVIAITAVSILSIQSMRDQLMRIAPQQTTHLVYHTTASERAKVQLPDGSALILAPATTIRYSRSFGQDDRTLTLDGEVFVTVSHIAGLPFIVRTGNTAVRVLGTSFTVRRYGEDTTTRVAVAQGRVALGQSVLSVGDLGIAGVSGTVTVKHDINVEQAFAWVNGRLVFDKTPLRDVIPDLKRWYGIEVDADPALLGKRVSATFDIETPAAAVAVIASVLDSHGTLTDGKAVFTSLMEQ